MGYSKSISKREVYSNTIPPQETIKSQINTFAPQATRERRIKPKVSRRKKIIKIRAEINEVEMNKAIVKINENISQFFENQQN